MNKKIVLAHVAAFYIAMIGVGNAAPPIIEPVAVETVEGNPLEVTVTNTPEIRIPSTGVAECDIFPSESQCDVEILPPESFPSGTNTFVIQQISANLTSFVSENSVLLLKIFHHGAATFRLPVAPGIKFQGVFIRNHNERVLIYHDATLGTVPLSPAEVTFWHDSGNTGTGRLKHTMFYSGYYTWFDQPQP